MKPNAEKIDPKDLIPHRKIPQKYPNIFTPNQWEWTLRNKDKNGLDQFVYRLNNQKYIHEPGFLQWVAQRRESILRMTDGL